MICTMLHCVRTIFFDMWRVERCVRFRPSWLSGIYQFILTPQWYWLRSLQLPTHFALLLSCLRLVLPVVRILLIKCPVLPFVVYLPKFRQYYPRTVLFKWYKFLITP